MKRIGVVPVSRGSGAGLITALLAVEAVSGGLTEKANRVLAVELGRGNLYDQLCADRWFQLRPMISYWNCIHGEGRVERVMNPRYGVNWLLRTPEDRGFESLCVNRAVRLMYSLSGDVAFLDFSSVGSEELFDLLEDVDEIVAVVDPLPSKLLEGYERLYRLRLRASPVHWVVNRWRDEIDERELKKILGRERRYSVLPEIPRALMYQAEYSGYGLLEHPSIRKSMESGLKALLKRLSA